MLLIPDEYNDISILKHQLAFLESKAKHTGLVAGFGAGKSKAATFKTVEKLEHFWREKDKDTPNIDVAYYLPTYPLVKGIAFPNFKQTLKQFGISYRLNETDKEFITPYGKIIMRSMDKPEMIIGYEVGYSLIDEADRLPKKKMNTAYVDIVARNRRVLPNQEHNCVDMVSTPEGFNFMYDYFVKNSSVNRVMIQAKTSDNPHLPSSYIETLYENYTEEQIQAYTNGEFVNLTAGTVYHKFDRKRNHSDREIKPREVLHIGMDFNITNMSAIIHVTDSNIVTAVEEITKAYDTAEMITIIKQRFANHRIVVYPDASGDSRKTSSSDTDIKLLKKAGFTVKVDKSNPSVRDRITLTNSGFHNAKSETWYYVNTNNCPVYTEALEQMPYKKGIPDKESGFDHVTEAGGYCVWQIKKNKYVQLRAR